MKKCPFCAEEIQDEAIICRYCGKDLIPPQIKPELSESKSIYRLPETPEEHQILAENLLQIIADNTGAIKGWVTFFGVLAVIGLIAGFLWACIVAGLFTRLLSLL